MKYTKQARHANDCWWRVDVMSWPFSWKYDNRPQMWLRRFLCIYLKNNPAKLHPNPICIRSSWSPAWALPSWWPNTSWTFCILSNSHHVLNHLLPDKTNHEHNLRDRRHNRSLCVKADEKKLSNL